ncbi:hypothetical protein XENOCAPTIV_020611 [Xenoophorus captivus]|uniref:Uncharacterized protein n=2 Tax=Goodeidae TaxID=28758 RepID=A0ABV0Q6J0_9TELE
MIVRSVSRSPFWLNHSHPFYFVHCQIKQPHTKQSVTHSTLCSVCKDYGFYIYTMCMRVCMPPVFMCMCNGVHVEQQVLVWQRRDTRVGLLFPLQSVSARSELPFAFPKRGRFLIGPGIGN